MEYMCPYCHQQSFVELTDKPLAVMKLQCCHCLKISSLQHDQSAIDDSDYHSTYQCLSCQQTTDISLYEHRLYQNSDVVCALCGDNMTVIDTHKTSNAGLFWTLFLGNGLTIAILFMWLTPLGQEYLHRLSAHSQPFQDLISLLQSKADDFMTHLKTLF